MKRKNIHKKTICKRAQRSSAKVKEEISRNNLRTLLSPWICSPAMSEAGEDIGIDYYVQIVTSFDYYDLSSEDSYLLLQIKSQTNLKTTDGYIKPYPVEAKKIIQWYNSSRG